jgi:hypothetical protein
MSRQQAIDSATAYFDQGTFQSTLARRVAIPTESQEPGKDPCADVIPDGRACADP